MKKYIISDIHGLGNVYYSIMNYLDNINKKEEIELYINGDLIDRGIESAEILLDIKERIESNKFKIIYLGGNHELMMHEVFEKRKKGLNPLFSDWYDNGGWITDYGLEKKFEDTKEILKVSDFVSNLKIYHKFNEKINNKNIVLVHAACPFDIKDECDIRIKDGFDKVYTYVWTREHDRFIPFKCKIGNEKHFTIVGHTPNNSKYGFEYHSDGNFLNIDGGCACYASGLFNYNHCPLVEIKDGCLKILTFNNNNEIIYGNYFLNNKIIPFSKKELDEERKNLNKNMKVKKLIMLEDGIIDYER